MAKQGVRFVNMLLESCFISLKLSTLDTFKILALFSQSLKVIWVFSNNELRVPSSN